MSLVRAVPAAKPVGWCYSISPSLSDASKSSGTGTITILRGEGYGCWAAECPPGALGGALQLPQGREAGLTLGQRLHHQAPTDGSQLGGSRESSYL